MSSIRNDPRPPAVLALADGTVFLGRSIGAPGAVTAEVVFNTAMTGYQEILTDPSYTGQIVTLTYPHIGNVGVNPQDEESAGIAVAGLVVRCASPVVSNFRARGDLSSYLRAAGTVAIADIDTRALTRRLRVSGAQPGTIAVAAGAALTEAEIESARSSAAAWGSMVGRDLASQVSTERPYRWTEGAWSLRGGADGPGFSRPEIGRWRVVAYDFGVKRNILRLMAERGIEVTVVPARTPLEEALKLEPDGIFLSNGPGDPEPCDYAIAVARECLRRRIPLFGICLGHQIMGLACGGRTVKMKFGHHGANHPVLSERDRRVRITSQNHGFAVDAASLPDGVRATYHSLFDGSLQGLEFTDAPAFSFQGHPEASPGPHDIGPLFDHFVELMRSARR